MSLPWTPNNKIPQRLKPAEKELLLKIAAAGNAGYTVDDITTGPAATLFNAHWLMCNQQSINGNSVLVALSPTGKEKADSYASKVADTDAAEAPARAMPRREDILKTISTDIPIPEKVKRTRVRESVYTFDALTAKGMSFFVAQPAEFAGRDFAASKSATVGTANRKAKEAWEATPADQRSEVAPKFEAFNVEEGGVKGARIFRVA